MFYSDFWDLTENVEAVNRVSLMNYSIVFLIDETASKVFECAIDCKRCKHTCHNVIKYFVSVSRLLS